MDCCRLPLFVRAGRFVFWCPLVGAESDSCEEKWPMEGSHFPPGQGTFPKIGVQFWGKIAAAGYIHRRFFDTAG